MGVMAVDQAFDVTIHLVLEDCEDDTAEVYGTLSGSQDSSEPHKWTFFQKLQDDRVTVRKGESIPLLRSYFPAATEVPLVVRADLFDYRNGSPGRIASGSVNFTVKKGTTKEPIEGQFGSVQVRITA